MHFSLIASIALTLSTFATASPSQPLWQRIKDVQAVAAARVGLPGQQVLQPATRINDENPLVTFQSTTTQTRATTLSATPLPSGEIPRCNMIACASCRSFYACRGGESACFQCDNSHYCQCEASEPAAARKTCSLGPGRTVPCDDLPDSFDDFFVFPSPDHELAPSPAGSASAQPGHNLGTPKYREPGSDSAKSPFTPWDDEDRGTDLSTVRTCSLGPGRTVPCDSDFDEEIFEFGG